MCNVGSDLMAPPAADGGPTGAAATWLEPALCATPELLDRMRRHDAWLARVAERQRALSPYPTSVPHMRNVPAETFLDLFYAAGRPLVLEGIAADWPATQSWSPEYLASVIGDAEVTYQGGRNDAADFELAKDRHIRTMPFDRFIATAARNDSGNDAYITAYNSEANQQAFAPLMNDLGQLPYLDGGDGMLWIGPEGTFTPLHHDLTNNLLVQVVGRKQLHLIAPHDTDKLSNRQHVFSGVHDIEDPECLARFPLAGAASSIVIDLEPGDALYIPAGWWHQVRSLSFSVMLTYTNFLWANDAYTDYPGN
jgi:ribosomal protein L16 Arg81 hydroxylase